MLCEATWCRVLAQAVICPVTAKVWLHSQTSQCGTCCGKFVLGQVYLRVSRFLLFYVWSFNAPHTFILLRPTLYNPCIDSVFKKKETNCLLHADFRKNRITMFLIQEFQGLFPVPRILLHLWLFASGTCYDFGKKSLGCSCEQLLHANVVMINKSIIT